MIRSGRRVHAYGRLIFRKCSARLPDVRHDHEADIYRSKLRRSGLRISMQQRWGSPQLAACKGPQGPLSTPGTAGVPVVFDTGGSGRLDSPICESGEH